MSDRTALLGMLGLMGVIAVTPAAQAAPCERSLWGCPSTENRKETREPQARYNEICGRGRKALQFTQSSAMRELGDTVTELTEAVQLLPAQPEGWALLGVMHLELGHYDEAEPLLRRAEAVSEEIPSPEVSVARRGLLASLDPRLETMVVADLAFLQALHGDVSGALERSRRLLLRRGPSHRALWRIGDLLMAQGSLEEATTVYERACALPRGSGNTYLEVSRPCHSLLVALDRGERARTAFVLRRAATLDADHRAVEMADIYPPYDREYYRALTLSAGCPRRAAFQAYLREASQQPGVPPAYIRRAEEHLQAENNVSCPAEL